MLTATGKEQCLQLRDEFPFAKEVSAVFASPLQRTIQTAAWTFGPELQERQLPFVLVPNAQEISGFQCDFGWEESYVKSSAPNLIAEAAPGFDKSNIDTTLVDGSWNSKVSKVLYNHDSNVKTLSLTHITLEQKGIYAPTLPAVRRRAAELRRWLWSRPEEHIALVTHGGFLHYLMEDWTTYDKAHSKSMNPSISEFRTNLLSQALAGETVNGGNSSSQRTQTQPMRI